MHGKTLNNDDDEIKEISNEMVELFGKYLNQKMANKIGQSFKDFAKEQQVIILFN